MDKAFIKNPVEAYEKLKEENKKLKAENEKWKKTCDILALKRKRDFSDFQFQYKECQETARTYLDGYSKLKQTLTEIKEIASKVLLNTHDLEQFKDADALFGALLEINKKISECEVINER